MKQLHAENARLKRMYADIAMQNELVKEALAKKEKGCALSAGYCAAMSREIVFA
jgi:hypothetical protein